MRTRMIDNCEKRSLLTCSALSRPHRRLLERKYTSSRFIRDLIAGSPSELLPSRWRWRWRLAAALRHSTVCIPRPLPGLLLPDGWLALQRLRPDRRLCGDPLPGFTTVWSGRPAGCHPDVRRLLILFGLARFGRLIEYIPLSVTLGFTSGIGITIGTMQIKDFLGLQMPHVRALFTKVGALFMALPTANFGRRRHRNSHRGR